ncbi:MAG: Fur family transcriptional regulator [Bdellovibrionales bacterium CG10_big_fil_rev_8_21_14_0_10_45_34]|nr:MAG: Fur family transcriptional regulator [Bdellovibrionales bacterium CG10_big_fil_rev_8_21_14_0_10_45_34]
MAPLRKDAQQVSNEKIVDWLKAAGLSATSQRIAITRFVLCEADHPTADEVHRWTENYLPKVSLATVYNTLGTLVQAGLLKEVRLAGSDRVIYDCKTHDHFHFLDEASGQIYDLDSRDVELNFKDKKMFNISSFDLLIRGRVNKNRVTKKQ